MSAEQKQDILNRAKLVAGSVALIVGADVDTAANSEGVAVENNSLKVATTLIKVSGKIFKVAVKKGKVTIKDLKSALKEEGFDILDSLITLGDGQVDINDAKAIIDLVVGQKGLSPSQAYDKLQFEPPRDYRRLNILREYDNEKTNLHS